MEEDSFAEEQQQEEQVVDSRPESARIRAKMATPASTSKGEGVKRITTLLAKSFAGFFTAWKSYVRAKREAGLAHPSLGPLTSRSWCTGVPWAASS